MINKKLFSCVILFVLALGLISLVSAQSDVGIISLSLVNQDPDPAVAGEIVEVRIGVENLGGESLEDRVVELVLSYPFEPISGESLVEEVGTIQGYQGYEGGDNLKIIKFKVKVAHDATEGQYDLNVLEYEAGKKDTASLQRTFGIDVENKENAEIIYIDKVELTPGKQTPMTFTINNVGSAPLRDITFSWENEDDIILPVGSDNTKYIKYLDVGESTDVSYDVIADTNADAGLYKLILYLTYSDSSTGEKENITTNAGIYVGGATDFDVAFSESSSGEIAFSIANIGSNPATSVSVIIPEQAGWRVSGSNSVIIGNLNTGDYTIASFTLQSTARAQESSEIQLQIDYTDTMGERNSVEKEVELGFSELMSGNSTSTGSFTPGSRPGMAQRNNTTLYIWLGAAAVAIVVGIILWRKHRKKTRK